ncbi:MAG: endonuclease/exonuclease/phosphatase family protein [Natronosporangium sp.]
MRVLTWNLWWRHGPWKPRLDAIAATLAEVAPDVCGLQEVWADEDANLAAELAERLEMHWCWAGRPPNLSWQREFGSHLLAGNAVLSRWPIAEQAEVPLPPTDDHPRLALHARVETPAGSLPFFTTHFSHQLGASAVRLAQARVLAGFVGTHATGHPLPPVVTGDLNAEPDSDELRLLGGMLTPPAVPGQVLVDAWRYADPDQPAAGLTWVRRNPYRATDPAPDARIDHILVGLPRDGLGRIVSARLAGHMPVADVWPSDHFAVVADLDA